MIFIEKIYNVINGNTPLLYSINNYDVGVKSPAIVP